MVFHAPTLPLTSSAWYAIVCVPGESVATANPVVSSGEHTRCATNAKPA